VLLLVYVQVLAGAVVAGIDGGLSYNTWPLMNGAFVPDGLGAAAPWYLNLFENPLTVQFDHRMLGYTVVTAAIAQAIWLSLKRDGQPLVGSAVTLAVLALLQATLGVWTLLLAVPIQLGLAHQAGAIFVFATALYHFWRARHEAAPEATPQIAASA
jgi:cytochrome c oxidase assembly protein subunit 15